MKSTSREWYYHPVDEFIFQEYSDRRDTELIFDSGVFSTVRHYSHHSRLFALFETIRSTNTPLLVAW